MQANADSNDEVEPPVDSGAVSAAPPEELSEFLTNLRAFSRNRYRFGNGKALRGSQCPAFTGYADGIAEGKFHGFENLPTGVGKTPLSYAIAKCYLKTQEGKPKPKRVLFVVPLDKLGKQADKGVLEFTPELKAVISKYKRTKIPDDTQIVITSYQAITADKDHSRFPDDEYGMVIYDECHTLTAEKWGEAVERFKNLIQLGLTATPDYSAEKTVRSRLPHCYFERKPQEVIGTELCHPVPVLLKTNTTINPVLFGEFVKKQEGGELTKDQMAKLINQQARNEAVMRLYLKGDPSDDPDKNWESHLGETGLILCANTTHADDFSRQMHNLLQKEEYKAEREWLEQQGLEIIAPVHNNLPLQRINGKMQAGTFLRPGLIEHDTVVRPTDEAGDAFYTKDEIYQLHDQGKILNLGGVIEPTLGFNVKRLEFVADLPDRLSKLLKTQIVGRGLRINEGEPHGDKFGGEINKECTFVDVIDKNIYERFEGNEQMLPIHTAEVLKGAAFRERRSRKHLLTKNKYKAPPSDMQQGLSTVGVQLITGLEQIQTISAEFERKREEAEKEKNNGPSEGFWTSERFGSELQKVRPDIKHANTTGGKIIKNIRDQLQASDQAAYRDIPIPHEAIEEYEYNRRPAYAIRQSEAEQIVAAYTTIKDKPAGFWSSDELGKEVQRLKPEITNTRGTGQEIIADIRRQLQTNNSAIYKNVPVPREAIAEYEYNNLSAYAIRQDEGKKIAIAEVEFLRESPNEVPTGYWSGQDLTKALQEAGVQVEDLRGYDIIAKVRRQHKESDVASYRGVPVSRQAIREYNNAGSTAYALRQLEGQQIVAAAVAAAKKEKPKGYWSGAELGDEILKVKPDMKAAQSTGVGIIRNIRKQHISNEIAIYNGIPIPRAAIISYECKGKPAYALRETEGTQIVATYAIKKRVPEGYWPSKKLGEAIQAVNTRIINPQSAGQNIFTGLRKQHETSDTAFCKEVPVRREAFTSYEYNNKPAFALREAECLAIVARYAAEQQATTEPDVAAPVSDNGVTVKEALPDAAKKKKR